MKVTSPLNIRFLSITGADSLKFLQGQASCDVFALDQNSFSFGTLNTPKGRMYSLFKVIQTDEGLILGMHESLFETTLSKLQKYAVFSKCTLKEVSLASIGLVFENQSGFDDFCIQNAISQGAFRKSSKQTQHYLLTNARELRIEVWLPLDEIEALIQNQTALIPSETWYALETLSGIPELYPESLEEFILQNLNLHELNAVSFKKGCYTGQEIIARLKYLGTQKKQLLLLRSDTKFSAPPLAAIFDEDAKKQGEVVRSHWSEETGFVCLAIVPVDIQSSNENLFLDEKANQALSVHLLDYSAFKM